MGRPSINTININKCALLTAWSRNKKRKRDEAGIITPLSRQWAREHGHNGWTTQTPLRLLPRIAASRASWIKSCTEDTSLFARDFFTTTTELSLGKNLPWNIWRNSCIWWMKGRRLGWRECVRLGEGLDARVFFSFTWFSLFLSFPSLPYDRWPNHPPISSHRIIPLHSHNCKFPFFWCIIKQY